MISSLLSLVLISFGISDGLKETEWCCIFCPNSANDVRNEHTVCKFPRPGFGPNCSTTTFAFELTQYQRIRLLKMHNIMRQMVALGKIKQVPPAANMMEMIWDDELEAIVKRWNEQCLYGHEPHDKCRHSYRFKVGQNAAFSNRKRVDTLVQYWFDEYLNVPASEIDKLTNGITPEGKKYGHFTQLAWANCYRMGCSVHGQLFEGDVIITVFCNYGPGGNVVGLPVYTKREPCSACPAGTECSKAYPGLCALKCSSLNSMFCSGAEKPFLFPSTAMIGFLVIFYSCFCFISQF